MNTKLALLIAVACFGFPGGKARAASPDARVSLQLAEALRKEDLALIRAAVAAGRAALGEQAGVPEVADQYIRVPKEARPLTPAEARRGFAPDFKKLESLCWWRVGLDPTKLTAPLRAPASVITGGVAVHRAKLGGAERSLAMAKDAAEFLMWAQEQAGAGLYPFPAARGTSSARAMEVATRFLEKAEKAGKLDTLVRNGWAFDDAGDGGLQFDNGECGVAMFELYEATQDARYLDSARRAADWAATRPLCPNWNYNSFSVQLLAKAFAVTRDPKYRDAALKKARLGVIPGQLTDGPHAGRWLDPHNARPAYHYVMMGALAQLAAVLPPEHEHRAEVRRALTLGLQVRNAEIVTRGVMTKDKAVETLLLVTELFAADTAFLRDTQTATALDVLVRLVAEEYRRGKAPLSPAGWGLVLAHLAHRNGNE